MASILSQHHSFDIGFAAKYGVEEAVLIHHFQHWIRINRMNNKNIKEGRCWTYQTRKDIQVFFPYWNEDQIRRLCERLEFLGVILIGNFNKTSMDRTLWYSFCDEEAFAVDEESLKKCLRKANLPNGSANSSNGNEEIITAVPDPITDTKKNKEKESASADASALTIEFISLLKEIHGSDFSNPNVQVWTKDFDKLLRIEKRDPDLIRKVMRWAIKDPFWQPNILSPKKLRQKFLTLKLQMESQWNTNKKTPKQDLIQPQEKTTRTLVDEDTLKRLFPNS